jgi:hypothetical protein
MLNNKKAQPLTERAFARISYVISQVKAVRLSVPTRNGDLLYNSSQFYPNVTSATFLNR